MSNVPLSIQTPAGLVEVGDTVVIDVSNDPVARNHAWGSKEIVGRAVGIHADHLLIMIDVAPRCLTSPEAFGRFCFNLRPENADQVVEVRKP